MDKKEIIEKFIDIFCDGNGNDILTVWNNNKLLINIYAGDVTARLECSTEVSTPDPVVYNSVEELIDGIYEKDIFNKKIVADTPKDDTNENANSIDEDDEDETLKIIKTSDNIFV